MLHSTVPSVCVNGVIHARDNTAPAPLSWRPARSERLPRCSGVSMTVVRTCLPALATLGTDPFTDGSVASLACLFAISDSPYAQVKMPAPNDPCVCPRFLLYVLLWLGGLTSVRIPISWTCKTFRCFRGLVAPNSPPFATCSCKEL